MSKEATCEIRLTNPANCSNGSNSEFDLGACWFLSIPEVVKLGTKPYDCSPTTRAGDTKIDKPSSDYDLCPWFSRHYYSLLWNPMAVDTSIGSVFTLLAKAERRACSGAPPTSGKSLAIENGMFEDAAAVGRKVPSERDSPGHCGRRSRRMALAEDLEQMVVVRG